MISVVDALCITKGGFQATAQYGNSGNGNRAHQPCKTNFQNSEDSENSTSRAWAGVAQDLSAQYGEPMQRVAADRWEAMGRKTRKSQTMKGYKQKHYQESRQQSPENI